MRKSIWCRLVRWVKKIAGIERRERMAAALRLAVAIIEAYDIEMKRWSFKGKSLVERGFCQGKAFQVCRAKLVELVSGGIVEGAKLPGPTSQPINIIFEGAPGLKDSSFVEVELDDGRSIDIGEWIKRLDGLWALRITKLPNA